MEIRIYPARGIAEALTFQQAIPPIYQEVYPAPGKVAPKLKRELNSFLNTWAAQLPCTGPPLHGGRLSGPLISMKGFES